MMVQPQIPQWTYNNALVIRCNSIQGQYVKCRCRVVVVSVYLATEPRAQQSLSGIGFITSYSTTQACAHFGVSSSAKEMDIYRQIVGK